MAEGIDEGVSYLRALKQSSSLQEGTAAAPARESAAENLPGSEGRYANATERFPGKEKRRSTRYKCEGSAGMREEGCDVHTWASFTDISLHGCYVEATTAYRVGVTLGLKLEANGYRVEATGDVRVSYPNLGMGISFTKMSEEDRERLRELVRSISRPSVILGGRVAARAPATAPTETLPGVANPTATLQAMSNFFEDRHMMGREEFLRILRKSQ